MPPVGLISLATASPPHDMPQAEVAAIAREVFLPRFPAFDRMAPVFGTAGVRHRQAVMPMEWYLKPRGWPERMSAYTDGAVELFARAAEGALAEAGLTGAEVDIIVTVSSTGIAAPSLEARAMGQILKPSLPRIGWRELIRRVRSEKVIWHAHRLNKLLVGFLLRLIGRDRSHNSAQWRNPRNRCAGAGHVG